MHDTYLRVNNMSLSDKLISSLYVLSQMCNRLKCPRLDYLASNAVTWAITVTE